jgi:putative SOS response-associated peptidase YedK
MCGRFNVIDNPGLRALLADLGLDQGLPTAVNIAPTEAVPLVRSEQGRGRIDQARWWLTPSWAPRVEQKYAMFNARSETLASSRAFRRPFASQRGIVPMSSFIEWREEAGVKQPWLISSDTGALAVAALWDLWHGEDRALLSCTLITTGAADSFSPWHRRMPVVLAPADYGRWLDNSAAIAADDPLLAPRLAVPLVLAPLARAVGNSRHKDPALMRPVGDAVVLAR